MLTAHRKWSLIKILILANCSTCISFNVDVSTPYVYQTTHGDDFFGYSVALHQHKDRSWLIVGAPLGGNTSQVYQQRYGAVHMCDLSNRHGRCFAVTGFDLPTPNIDKQDKGKSYVEYKKGQWLGATVRASEDYLMACAPRYAWSGREDKRKHYPVGKCEVIDFKNETRWIWSPCSQVPVSLEKSFGHCNFGLDASFDSKGTMAAGGAPSIQNGKGRMLAARILSPILDLSSAIDEANYGDYLGYAVAIGKMNLNDNKVLIAGVPNGDDRKGEVIIFKAVKSYPISIVLKNPTMQIGSYFGASLVSTDVNGDGYEDLIVGAPLYSTKVEEGAVVVYINNQKEILDLSPIILYGDSKIKGRFGTSIAAAKDMNNDGYDDVVIGAPYEDDGKGAVYVYHGSRSGLQNSYAQKITPSQFESGLLSLQSFGASLSSGIDIDYNGYPDLAVGSFLSHRAVFLRSRPVAELQVRYVLDRNPIDLESTKNHCIAPGSKQRYSCLETWLCFKVKGMSRGSPKKIKNIFYEISFDDKEPLHKRIGRPFKKNPYRTNGVLHVRRRETCVNIVLYAALKPRDIYKPIVFKVSYSYKPKEPCNLCPVIKSGSIVATASYVKNCSSDLVCEADLRVDAKIRLIGNETEVNVGVTNMMHLEISVQNHGENAFLSQISVLYTIHVIVVGIQLDKGTNVLWKVGKYNKTHNLLVFDAGNPIHSFEKEKYDVKFAVKDIPFSVKRLNFNVTATTDSNEKSQHNNTAMASVNVSAIADLTVTSTAIPEQLKYNRSQFSVDVGPFIAFKFLIQNKGPATVESSKVSIFFPYKLHDDFLLNLLAVRVEGSLHCNINESAYDPIGFKLRPKKSGKDSLSRKRRTAPQRLDCSNGHCHEFTCNIGRLRSGESVVIAINSSLVESTFAKKIKKDALIVVRAVVQSEVIKQPDLHFPDTTEATVHIISPNEPNIQEKDVPWWIILISVIAGLGLMAGVVFVLYKSGFFKRKRRDYSLADDSTDD